MADRRILNTWKEIAAYLSRGVRTVQRWELNYGLPVHRPGSDAPTVYAFSDEIDSWLERSQTRSTPYLRPTFLVVDVVTPNALSDLKLAIEAAKFNVLTAFSAAEALVAADKFEVDGFVVDSILLDMPAADLGRELRRLFPSKPRVLVGDDASDAFDTTIESGGVAEVVEWLLQRFGQPRLS